METEAAREQMIHQQVRAWEVLDARTLEVMQLVPRERFVPPPLRSLAFADSELLLTDGERMLAPKVVGRILQALEPAAGESALEIGSGSGYLTACLARLCGAVRSLERHAEIAEFAQENIARLGLAHALVEHADAYAAGALGTASYDLVVLTGSLPVYDPRFEQRLAPGGRLFAIVGMGTLMQAQLVTRVSAAQCTRQTLFETVVAPLRGALRPEPFRF
jgi:protein-L-isoaspartate(D-aspartate) O-methyltransferase